MQPELQIVSIGIGGAKLLAHLETDFDNVQYLAIDVDHTALALARAGGAATLQLQVSEARRSGPAELQQALLDRAGELHALTQPIRLTFLVANLAEPIASAIAPSLAALLRDGGSRVHAIVVVPHAVLSRKTAQRAGVALNQLTARCDSVSMPQLSHNTEDLTVQDYLDQLDRMQLRQLRDAIAEHDIEYLE